MNKILAMLGCLVFVLALWGCGQQNEKKSGQPQLESETREDAFPEVMVGVWEAEVTEWNKWGIKFEPDGSIQKIIHSVAGPVKLSEGGVYGEGPDEGTYFFFIMGPCEAKYSPLTRTLEVKIVVESYTMKLPTGELEGRIEDYFSGKVSEDGQTWEAEWLNYAWLEGADPLPIDVIEANPVRLVFSKVKIE